MSCYPRLRNFLHKTLKYSTQFSQQRYIRHCSINSQSNGQTIADRRRVVVTGIGVISPVGCDVKSAWSNILNGYCGIKSLSDQMYKTLPCQIAAKIDENNIKLQEHFSKTELRSIAPSTAYALIAGNY